MSFEMSGTDVTNSSENSFQIIYLKCWHSHHLLFRKRLAKGWRAQYFYSLAGKLLHINNLGG